MTDKFINIPFSINTLDIYFIRTSILKAINKSLLEFKGKLLDIGCGKMPYKNYLLEKSNVKEYIGLDIDNALVYDSDVKPDYTWDGIKMPFEDSVFDCALGTEVLEHCFEPEIILKEVYRVLKPGGALFLTVPFLWGLHEVPFDAYRYTPFSLERHLKNSGFNEISIKATGGWHASMAQMLGLWVRRSPLQKHIRSILSVLLKPIIFMLLKMDNNNSLSFSKGPMITGLYAICKK